MKILYLYHFLIVYIIIPKTKSQISLDFKLVDFINSEGLTQSHKKCKLNSRIYACDSRFQICLSSNEEKKCDILKKQTATFSRKMYIPEVLNEEIKLKKLPKTLIIDVTVEDMNKSKSEIINTFKSQRTPFMNEPYLGFPTPLVYIKDLRLQYKFKFRCQVGFFGNECEKSCTHNSTETQCLLLKCKTFCLKGTCKMQSNGSKAFCNCFDGWEGLNCSERIVFCDKSFCESISLTCDKAGKCYCSDTEERERSYCMQQTSFRKVGNPEQTNYVYIIAASCIITVLFGLIVFVTVTFLKCRTKSFSNSDSIHEDDEGTPYLQSQEQKLMISSENEESSNSSSRECLEVHG